MSNLAVQHAPRPERRDAPGRPLRAVDAPAPARRPRMAYAIVAVAGAVAIAAAQMGLSVLTTQDAYHVAELTDQQRALDLEAQALADEVAGLSSPQYLAANAAALGMVIDASPTYLRLSDAAIIGTGEAAGGASDVDASGASQVGNALVRNTPLVTDPSSTLEGHVEEPEPEGATPPPAEQELPPPLTEGIPSPNTR